MAPKNQKPEAGAKAWCKTCGEEIRFTGRRWAHEAHYPDGHEAVPIASRHEAVPIASRVENVNLRIRAGAVVDEAHELRAEGEPAEFKILAADAPKKLPSFRMVAYTGGPMNPSGWYRPEPIVVDLQGMKIPSQMLPIDKDHGVLVGHSTSIEKTPGQTRLKLTGVLSGYSEVSDDEEAKAARSLVRMGKNDFPYQASIDASVRQIEKIEAGEKCKVNGQSLTGPLYVARASTLKGVAILASGADGLTQTTIAARPGAPTMTAEFIAWLKGQQYTDRDIAGMKKKKIARLQSEWTESTLRIQASGGKTPEELIAARRAAEAAEETRVAGIKAICGKKEYSGLTTLIDDPDKPGAEKSVSIVAHAIAEGWTERQTELECKRAARPAGPIGIYVHGHDTDCTLEALQCAMLLKADPKNKAAGPQQDILCHPVFKTPLACNTFVNVKGEEQEVVPAFLRAGLNTDQRQKAMESGWKYRDMSVVDLCAEALRLDGKTVPRGRSERIQAAFSSGALNNIFTTNINVILLATYSEAADFTNGWTSTTDVNDFKSNERPRMVKGGPLAKLPRGGTADHTSRSDTAEAYKIQRYSRQFQFDEQDAVDDHWNAFADIPVEMGNASGRMRPSLVAAIMLANANITQTGRGLFNATDGNLLTGAALSLATFQAAVVAMGKFQENGVNLGLQPTHVIVPTDLAFLIDQILHSGLIVVAGANATNLQYGNYNPAYMRVKAQPMDTPFLANGVTDPDSGTVYAGSTSTWYLASAQANTIEVGYLRGTGRAPQMRSWMLQWGQFGIGYDVRLDIGAKGLDWRGFVQNTA